MSFDEIKPVVKQELGMVMNMALVTTIIVEIQWKSLEPGVIQQILVSDGITVIVIVFCQKMKSLNFLT